MKSVEVLRDRRNFSTARADGDGPAGKGDGGGGELLELCLLRQEGVWSSEGAGFL